MALVGAYAAAVPQRATADQHVVAGGGNHLVGPDSADKDVPAAAAVEVIVTLPDEQARSATPMQLVIAGITAQPSAWLMLPTIWM
jgi:hypothetical protein